MESKRYNILRYNLTLSKDQIMTFVSGLHQEQLAMIDQAVKIKEREGFPEANEVINRIRSL